MLTRDYHDCNVTSIALIDDTLSISIVTTAGSDRLNLKRLKKLRINDFLEGNIVNSAKVYSGSICLENESIVRKNLAYLYDIDCEAIKNKPSLGPFIDALFKKLCVEELAMFELISSYGCFVVALAENINAESDQC